MSAGSRIGLLLAGSSLLLARAAVAGETRNVLVIYSNSRMLPANVELDRGLRETVKSSTDRRVELHSEFLDAPHAGGKAHDDAFAAYVKEKYSTRLPDTIVVGGPEAFTFLLRYRARLFPRAPVVHMAVPRSFLQSIPPLPADVVGVPVWYDFAGSIEQALRWHSRARRLVVVTGASDEDRRWEAYLRSEVSRFGNRVTIEFLAALPTGDVVERLSQLSNDAVVFTPGYFEDGQGRSFIPQKVAQTISAAATAPVYGPFDTFIGTGIVGGRMASFEAIGRQAARTVNALLAGAGPGSLRLPERMPTELHVDWRQARRWGIAESDFPAGTVVHFKEPPFWQEYGKWAILAIILLTLQAGLIAALLVERGRSRRAARQVQDERVFLRQVIDINPNLIFAKDRLGRFTLANQAVADIYGTTVDALVGMTDADFNPSRDEVEMFRRADLEVMDTLQERFISEERVTDAAGKVHWLQTVKRPVLGHNGTANQVLGTATDITRRKQTELQLAQQRGELAHLSRVAMLGELSGSLAHELNQPLSAILSNAQAAQHFLSAGASGVDEVREILKDIVEQDKRAGEVIQRLRLLLMKGEVIRQPLDLNEVLLDVLKLIRSDLLNQQIVVKTDLAPDLPTVFGDRVPLQQVLLNLVVNGCDAMGGVEPSLRKLSVKTASENGTGVRVSITDQGCGIPPEQLPHVFEPFFTTKRQGMGLGLSVCHTIIEAHNGRLWAESEPGAGATFHFNIPAGGAAS